MSIESVEKSCRDLVTATSGKLEWEWEQRMLVMLSVFEPKNDADTATAVETAFPHRWEGMSTDFPDSVGVIVRGLGGLRAGQALLSSDPTVEPVLYCAWWPWGGGSRVSLRVGCWAADKNREAEIEKAFRTWFE